MDRQLTIRGMPDDLMRKLRGIAVRRGSTIDALVVELLTQALGSSERRGRLEFYATSSAADAGALDDAIRQQRRLDPNEWE
jgi:plasmid stability protein